jgi:Tfp pilus assembly protein PilE
MRSERGMTILDVVIMVVVLAVIGAITYPQFRLMVLESREGRTKASLGDLRGAIAIYYSDNFGLYPSDEGTPDTRLRAALTPQYIKAVPGVDLPHHYSKSLNTIQDRFTGEGDWVYSMLNGFVAVNSDKTDTKGEPISNW